ncbi:Forkhead-associated domain protein, partial [Candidatus Magnetomorum sp. HK-1]
MVPILEIIDGPLDGLQFRLYDNSDIGFDNRNAIILNHDRTISGSHACVDIEGRDWLLSDVKSSNGTYINNQKLKPFKKTPLTDKCFFCIGATIVQFYHLHESKYQYMPVYICCFIDHSSSSIEP